MFVRCAMKLTYNPQKAAKVHRVYNSITRSLAKRNIYGTRAVILRSQYMCDAKIAGHFTDLDFREWKHSQSIEALKHTYTYSDYNAQHI